MRPPLYGRALREDLDRWVNQGILTVDQRTRILEDVGEETGRPVTDWLGLFGAILIGAGALSFVAANWEDSPKWLRLILLFGGLAGAYGLSVLFFAGGRERMGQAFVLLGVALFGATIMLLGQTYHFNADYPGGVMLWGIGALAAAALVPSRTALGAAMILGGVWTFIETADFTPALHLPYLVYWGATVALVYALAWWAGFHLAILTGIAWLVVSSDFLEDALGLPDALYPYTALAFVVMLAGLVRVARPARIASTYGGVVFLTLLCIDYFDALEARSLFFVALYWAALVGVLCLGVMRQNRALINMAMIAFGAGVLITYFHLFGSLLETALGFTLGGVLFIALSFGFQWASRRLMPKDPSGEQGGAS